MHRGRRSSAVALLLCPRLLSVSPPGILNRFSANCHMPFEITKLYPITDRRLSGLSHAEQVARLVEGGATFVQLREKHLSPREFYREAEEALRVARARGAKLIINDRADIALALGADGVHLGQDDMPPEAARALLGGGAVVGCSTHSVEQAIAAARLPLDYVAVGPIFETKSKERPEIGRAHV